MANASPLHYPLISEWIVYNKSPSKKVVKLTHQQSQTQTYKYTMANRSEIEMTSKRVSGREREIVEKTAGNSVELS